MTLAAFSILVPEYVAGISFFWAGLGFTLTEDVPQDPKRWVTVAPPGDQIRLVLARADIPAQRSAIGNQSGGRVWLFLQSDGFTADSAKIIAAGGTFEQTPRQKPPATNPPTQTLRHRRVLARSVCKPLGPDPAERTITRPLSRRSR